MKILVVEDDSSVRETLGMVLEASHHQVALVEGGLDALKYLKTDWPDVMLLDLTLAEMTGEEVFRTVQQNFGRVPPTIVLSAVQRPEERVKGLSGALFLAKPYSIEDLENAIFQVTQTRAA